MTTENQPITQTRRWALGAMIAGSAALISGCGPNDRLRDDYMGKPTPPEYRPIKRDQYGNPIIPEVEKDR